MGWARRRTVPVPSISSHTETVEINDYSNGMNDFIANDVMPVKSGQANMWRGAQNARIITLGEYETRKGLDFHSATAGETLDRSVTSVSGAADQTFNDTKWLAQLFIPAATGPMPRLDININNAAAASGAVIVELWTGSNLGPGVNNGEMIGRSSISDGSLSVSYGYLIARFIDAPLVTTGTRYFIVVYTQPTALGSFNWSSTASATTAFTSIDSGNTWVAANFALNFKEYYCTAGATLGHIRARKSDGTMKTVFAQGTTLYSVDDATGTLTAIKTGLSASATHYRFAVVNDILYYVNGFDGYRKWDFTTESQVSATNYSHIAYHKGLMFLVRTDDTNRIDFSNFGLYETFTSTDFIEVPSPKTGDPVTAILSLNGYFLIWTRNNKFIFSGADNTTFRLDQAPDQNGTYTQETVAADQNYAYYLSDDGMYRTNGNDPQLLSENNYNSVLTMATKSTACVGINQGRLYLWFAANGSASNNNCWVWNLNYNSKADTVESLDTDAPVATVSSSPFDGSALMVGSSVVGQVSWQELAGNDYTNMGGDIDFRLTTHYITFGTPAINKGNRYFKARFGNESEDYGVEVQYAYDLRENWQVIGSLDVQGDGFAWGDSSTIWGEFIWGVDIESEFSTTISGEYRRIALRYQHYATRQPIRFLGHTLVMQLRRLR